MPASPVIFGQLGQGRFRGGDVVGCVYGEFYADCSALPARTTVVTQLVRDGVLVEIDGVAAVTPPGR